MQIKGETMLYKKVRGGYLLRIERGEKVMKSLLKFVKRYKIRSGFMLGLGACEDLKLGYFDAVRGKYKDKVFRGEYEVTNLTGNIAWLKDEPIVHAHITISDSRFNAVAGHLWEGIVSGTMEIFIISFGINIMRAKDPETGLNPLKLSKVK